MVKSIKFCLKNIRLTAFYILFFFLFISITLAGRVGAKDRDITVFVLDTKVNINFVKNRSLNINRYLSHGSIVARIIREEAPEVKINTYSVENDNGVLSEKIYLTNLKRIVNYKTNHPRERILVLPFPIMIINHRVNISILNLLKACQNKAKPFIPYLINILTNETDMWLRYHALKTLLAIDPHSGLLSLLASLREDSQELVRIEARGLLVELKGK